MGELILMFLLGLSVGACAVAIGTCTLAEKALKIIKTDKQEQAENRRKYLLNRDIENRVEYYFVKRFNEQGDNEFVNQRK